MYGAIYGDIIGSYYERYRTRNYNFPFEEESTFTDDSVLTAAVCKAILDNPSDISPSQIETKAMEYAKLYKHYYSLFPRAGFGGMFSQWAVGSEYTILNSYGNGAAMRAVPIGYAYSSMEQTLLQAEASCFYTHNNEEAIIGAKAVAAAAYMARNGGTKKDIADYIEKEFHYDLSIMEKNAPFSCRSALTVPQAIAAFIQSEDYESAVRNAVALGVDADTQACIAGGIAEAFYGEIPSSIKKFCNGRLDLTLKSIIDEFEKAYGV